MATAAQIWAEAVRAVENVPHVAGQLAAGQVPAVWAANDPFVLGLYGCLEASVLVWILGILTKNYSWVDKMWSLLPLMYAWIFALHSASIGGAMPGPRMLLMAFLATLWGLRLTYNFARKGGYTWEGEDYRWPYLRKMMHWTVYQVFNLVFIAFYQNILIYAFCLPMYYAWRVGGVEAPLNTVDYVATAMWLTAWIIEVVADEQQWTFQTEKYRRIGKKQALDGDYAKGFLTHGLFRYSRHPNFFGEISIWWSFYVFSIAASGEVLNWSMLGTALLTMLFMGSTAFTEYITTQKYPEYKIYQKTTSTLIPWFPGTAKTKTK